MTGPGTTKGDPGARVGTTDVTEPAEIQMAKGRVYYDAQGILRVDYQPNIDITIEDAREVVNAIKSVGQAKGRLPPVLVDASTTRSIASEARKLFASKEAVYAYSAMAVMGGNPVTNLIVNVIIRLRSEGNPLRLFTNQREAIDWLKQYL